MASRPATSGGRCESASSGRGRYRSALPTDEHSAQIIKLQTRVRQLEDCLPEVATLISTLTLDRENLFISPSSQVSRVCNHTLHRGPGEQRC